MVRRLLLLALLAGCHHGPRLPDAELPAAMCTPANDGQTVGITGVLVMPEISFGCTDDCRLEIAASPGAHDGLAAWLSVGRGPDQVEAVATHGDLMTTGAKSTRADEIHIHPDQGGPLLAIGDAVHATGQLSLDGGACWLFVDTIEATGEETHAALPHVASMLFVDLDPLFARPNAAILRRRARRQLLAAHVPSRFVDREAKSAEHDGDAWDRWLAERHASRYVHLAAFGGETYVPGAPTKREISLPPSTTQTREDQLAALVLQLAAGEGTEAPHRAPPADARPDPKDNPLYLGP